MLPSTDKTSVITFYYNARHTVLYPGNSHKHTQRVLSLVGIINGTCEYLDRAFWYNPCK